MTGEFRKQSIQIQALHDWAEMRTLAFLLETHIMHTTRMDAAAGRVVLQTLLPNFMADAMEGVAGAAAVATALASVAEICRCITETCE